MEIFSWGGWSRRENGQVSLLCIIMVILREPGGESSSAWWWRAKNLNLGRVYVTEVEVVVDTKTFSEGSMRGPALLLNMGTSREGSLKTREAKHLQVLRGMIDMLGKNGVYQFPFPSHFISCKSLFIPQHWAYPIWMSSEESQPENLDTIRCRT